MPDREFLETYPLYRKLERWFGHELNQVPKVPITAECAKCGGPQTFLMVNEYFEGFQYANFPAAGTTVALRYTCTSCMQFQQTFLLRFDDNPWRVMKTGQYPAWELDVSKETAKVLGKHLPLFKRGLVCESQGYGVGAFAYYRRIVEATIDALLTDLGTLITGTEHEAYANALAEVKRTRITQDKIDLVKDLLPSALRPDGLNPLGILHSALSAGLHSENDPTCLESASSIREVLSFLLERVEASRQAGKSFTAGMRKLLEKREQQE